MANLDRSINYEERVIKEILDSPVVQKVIHNPTRVWVSTDQPSREMFDEEYLFKSWLTGQIERYGRVYDSIADYFRKEGRILPAEPKDFLKWFVNKAIVEGDFLFEQIEAIDFNLYHEEKLKTLNKKNIWDDLYKDLTEKGYIYTTQAVFNYVMEFKQLPGGNEKIQWRTSKADAIAFQIGLEFKLSQFNKCFGSIDGKPFTLGSKPKGIRKKPLRSIINKYKSKPDSD